MQKETKQKIRLFSDIKIEENPLASQADRYKIAKRSKINDKSTCHVVFFLLRPLSYCVPRKSHGYKETIYAKSRRKKIASTAMKPWSMPVPRSSFT